MKHKHQLSFSKEELQEQTEQERSTSNDGIEPLSEDELQMLSSSVKRERRARGELPPLDQSGKAALLRMAKKNKTFTAAALICVLCACAILLGACSAGLIFWSRHRRAHADYTIHLGDDLTYTVEFDHMMRDGILYLDLLPVKDYMGLIISGSDKEKKFTTSNGTFLTVEDQSQYAIINGTLVQLEGKAIVSASECLVPFEWFRKAIERGFVINLDEHEHVISIGYQYYDQDRTQRVELVFHDTPFPDITTLAPVVTEPPRLNLSYPFDIPEELMNRLYSEYLLLTNKTTAKLTADYVPGDLVDLSSLEGCIVAKDNSDYYLRADAAYALATMMKAMVMEVPKTAETSVTSAYRGYAHQNWLFYTYYFNQEKKKHPEATDEEIEAIVASYSARPGESEHQTGLCLDFTAVSIGGAVDESFESTEAFRWLSENAHKYGFILRYPKDKVEITGYDYEPWHYRFIGVRAAAAIYEQGLCLEEYLASVDT